MKFIDLQTQYQRIKLELDKRFADIFAHGQFIMGPEVFELEEELADYVGVKHCISVSSGTDALLIALMALDIKPGDEVIISPFSFFATVEVILLRGATPVFVDIDEQTYNLNPNLLEAAITENTKVIMPVSLYGQCADFKTINAIAAKHNISVIEDGAQSFGATHHGRRSCSLSTIGCTSFFPSKPLGCYGDGGACFTDKDELANIIRSIRCHGETTRYNHQRLGINARLDTLQAAVLLAKLPIFEEEVKQRQLLALHYSKQLQNHIEAPYIAPYNQSVYGQYTVQVTNRDALQQKLHEHNIPIAIHYPKPLHQQALLFKKSRDWGTLPIAEKAAKQVISLPFDGYKKIQNVQQFIDILNNEACTHAR